MRVFTVFMLKAESQLTARLNKSTYDVLVIKRQFLFQSLLTFMSFIPNKYQFSGKGNGQDAILALF